MENNYSLSVAFCTINETSSLIDAFTKVSALNCADEYVFIVAKNATAECKKTVEELCKNEKCRFTFQDGYGLGNAIRKSFDEAKGTHLILWPADDDMDIKAFPEMARLSRKNPEKIVTVSRWKAENGFEGYGKLRTVINFISQKAFAILFKSDLTDFTNPTQIAPVSIYRKIKWQGNDFAFMPEMIFKPLKIGCEFIEVPCKSIPRKDGKTNGSFSKFAKYYPVIFKIYKMKPEDIMKV